MASEKKQTSINETTRCRKSVHDSLKYNHRSLFKWHIKTVLINELVVLCGFATAFMVLTDFIHFSPPNWSFFFFKSNICHHINFAIDVNSEWSWIECVSGGR